MSFEFGLLLEQMKHFKIDMLLLPEANINPLHHTLMDNMRAATDLHLHHAKLHITNTPGFPTSTYQPGGVATVVHNKLALRAANTTNDPAGRWTSTTFRGKHRNLKIYCVYRVCSNTDSGPSTAFSQQEDFFLTQNKVVNPRSQVITDLNAGMSG